MTEDISVEFSLFVEHGREREAANFYAAAFGAREVGTYDIDGVLGAVEMRFGNLPVWVAGAHPKRETAPSYGGPFFPKAPGAVSTIFQLKVGSIDGAMQRALAAGAVIRDDIQTDTTGRRVASIFDPFGHIWALVQRKAAEVSRAA
ncbi:VOC family protein [Rhodopseudomonas palustris]|uniref:VOC domain-containing protein n=1 Tax=Rhodopseudomonas palustris (strain BisB18) TaxID=316056 RepID=Q21D38_RHOPB